MNVLIVVESAFGNTVAIAESVARGLRAGGATVTVVSSADAATTDGFDLIVVGAPTHNLGLPSTKSRLQATERGGVDASTGVREWLAGLPRLNVRAAVFDTHLATAFAGSAAKGIARLLRSKRATIVAHEGFIVAGSPPVLIEGELARAEAWGGSLV